MAKYCEEFREVSDEWYWLSVTVCCSQCYPSRAANWQAENTRILVSFRFVLFRAVSMLVCKSQRKLTIFSRFHCAQQPWGVPQERYPQEKSENLDSVNK